MMRPKSIGEMAEDIGDWQAADEAGRAGDYTLLDIYNRAALLQAAPGSYDHTRVYPGLSLAESEKRLSSLR